MGGADLTDIRNATGNPSVHNAIDCSNRKFIKIEPVISLSEGLHQILNNWSDEFGVNMKDLRDGWLRVTSTRQGGEHYTE